MSESWIVVKSDGSLILHVENDGATALRRGLEALEEPITLEEVAQRYPGKVRDVAADALVLLAKKGQP